MGMASGLGDVAGGDARAIFAAMAAGRGPGKRESPAAARLSPLAMLVPPIGFARFDCHPTVTSVANLRRRFEAGQNRFAPLPKSHGARQPRATALWQDA
jgi:hypothetical protein